MGLAAEYLGGAGLLVLIFLVLNNASASTSVIKQLSGFNTNAILALQGRNPTSF